MGVKLLENYNMKKYIAPFLLLAFLATANAVQAQSNAKSPEARQKAHDFAQVDAQKQSTILKFSTMTARFEAAYEEQDLESTQAIQRKLYEMSIFLSRSYGSDTTIGKEIVTIARTFNKYQFDFSKKESKKDVKAKGMPNEILKLVRS